MAYPVICALIVLVWMTEASDARRRYYRPVRNYAPPSAAMAIDLYTGRILYSKNANEPRFPASLTKIMTLYLLFDALRDGKLTMKTKLTVSAHAAAQSPTKLGLDEGDTITVADAIGAVVTKSANDMAVVIAEALAGSEEEFARLMTQKARTIGMINTTFRNASGLPNPEQRTTAQDLTILGKSILADHPQYSKLFSMKYFQYNGSVYQNHNTLLFTYAGMEGMKTGFTTASGFNLVATARRGDKRLLAVVLGGSSAGARNATMRAILDASWSKALTQVAARKAGILVAEQKAAPRPEKPAVAQQKPQIAAIRPSAPVVHAPPRRMNGAGFVSQARLKPDAISGAILFSALESGFSYRQSATVASNPAKSRDEGPKHQLWSDSTTDEAEEKGEVMSVAALNLAENGVQPRESKKNETLVVQAGPKGERNVSVHYKTVVAPVEEPSTIAAVADPIDELESGRQQRSLAILQAAKQQETPPTSPKAPIQQASREEPKKDEPKTLAAAVATSSSELDQPGPYHVQVGAFAAQSEAEDRLQKVLSSFGRSIMAGHPQFVMQVALPSGTMFRARFGKFANEVQAKAACRALKRAGFDCWDIKAQ